MQRILADKASIEDVYNEGKDELYKWRRVGDIVENQANLNQESVKERSKNAMIEPASFNGQFQIEHDPAITPEYALRLAEMVGSPDGSRVVLGDAKDLEWGEVGEIAALLYHLHIKGYAVRIFADTKTGQRMIRNEVLERTANAPDAFILRLFAQQVAAATRYDYSCILTYAAGKPGGHMNGYYTWPRLGYDGAWNAEEKAKFPEIFRSTQTIQDLMATPEGRQWWKMNGWAKELSFDLKPDSRSHQVLNQYLTERGIQ